jgi:hypothetical protein
MTLATITAGEAWGMAASILTVLTLILGGVWKVSRLAMTQITATRDNTSSIEALTRRLALVEGAVQHVAGKVADTMSNGS